VNRTTIYRRWPNRETLIHAALGQLLTKFDPLPDTGSLRGDLDAFAQRVATLIDQPAGQALLRAAMSPHASTSIADFVTQTMDRPATNAASLLNTRARARGEWTAPIPADQVLFTIVGAIWHRRMLEHAPIDPAWRNSLLELLMHGLAPHRCPPHPVAAAPPTAALA
jgi:AcrR family transcriptional regulator